MQSKLGDASGGPVNAQMSTTNVFIGIGCAVVVLAVAVVLFITCKKFLKKRKEAERLRRPYPGGEYRPLSNVDNEDEEKYSIFENTQH